MRKFINEGKNVSAKVEISYEEKSKRLENFIVNYTVK